MGKPDIVNMIMALNQWKDEIENEKDELDEEEDKEKYTELGDLVDRIDSALDELENL